MKKSILLLVFMYFTTISLAQVYETGITIGGSNYVGDIGRTNYIYPNKIAGAAFFKYNWNPRIALRATFSYLPIEGNDFDADTDYRRTRGINFTNTIHELAIGLEYNFYEYNLSEVGKTWTPYIILEIAGFNYQYQYVIIDEDKTVQNVFDSKNSFAIPFGIGIKSKLTGSLAIALESRVRYTFDDDLDSTTNSILPLDFGSNNSDWYMFTGVSIIYTFGRPPCFKNGL